MHTIDGEPYDLVAAARAAMLEEGFLIDFSPAALNEATRATVPVVAAGVRDLRALPWSSIDNRESRDLDQLEYAEALANGTTRLLIAIADVDLFVAQGSAADAHAAHNTTSIYTGAVVFPMLPEQLSEGLSSLLAGVERLAVVVELLVGEDGALLASTAYRALVQNHARLEYDSLGAWLEGRGLLPPEAGATGLAAQLRLQHTLAEQLRALRRARGALELETVEARPVIEQGVVVGLAVPHKSAARYVIENMMVAANGALAQLLAQAGLPSIQRVVRAPERWPRIRQIAAEYGAMLPQEPDARALADWLAHERLADPLRFPDLSLAVVKLLGAGRYTVVLPGEQPEGHFGLATLDYTHATAPNRRFVDLVTQRLLKAAISGTPSPYTVEQLNAIAERCNERQKAARAVERTMRKLVAAHLLSTRIGEAFAAIVTGVSGKGTFVRLLDPPAEGRVVEGEQGMDVGEAVRVRLIGTNPQRGFIDFART